MDLKEINKQYHKLMRIRGELIKLPEYKKCFNCNNVLNIKRFEVNSKKYQRPAAKGVNHWCNECLKNREI